MRNLKPISLGIIALLFVLQGCATLENSILGNKLDANPRKVLQGNPSEELQLKAVKRDDWNIRYIDHPYESVQRFVINKRLLNFYKIKNPSESVIIDVIKLTTMRTMPLYMIRSNHPISYLKNPSEELQLHALKNTVTEVIKFIKHPTEKVQLYAIRDEIGNINFINKPTEKVKTIVVEKLLKKYNFFYIVHSLPEYIQNHPKVVSKIKKDK